MDDFVAAGRKLEEREVDDFVAAGRKLEEREVDFFIRSSAGDDGQIDLGAFANLLTSLKMYEKKLEKSKK